MKKTTLLIFFTSFSLAQVDSTKFVTVIPSNHYSAGTFHRFLFGDHWRNLWATPIQVEVLDLDSFAGGLTPTEHGGGFQTRSLCFRGNDRKEYKFRSLDKDPTRILPDELQDTFVEDIVQDQISWTHPYSAIIAAPFVEAAGILQAVPRLVLLPNSDKLGEFQKDFGGLLGTLEENPDDKDGIAFANANKIKSTYSLFKELDEDNDEQVDAKEFLKARLIDIFLGDWDRHVDQWKWAGYKQNSKRIWKPIPRDRDQAFAKIDGIIPWGITLAIKQIESYETVYPLIDDMTWSGRHLDRKFLSSLSKIEWDSVTNVVINLLSDSLISYAVQRMPPQMYALEGKNIELKLRERRDILTEASNNFYRISAKYVDIRLSNKREYVEVHRLNDETVEVTVWKRDKETGEKKDSPLFRRQFFTNETKEIRIYLLGGDDFAKVSGIVNNSIEVHIDGGDGKDEIIDESKVNGYLFSVLPIPSADIKTLIYDSGKKSEIKAGASSSVVRQEFPKPENDTIIYEPTRDYGHDFRPDAVIGYNSADGVVLGLGQILYEYRVKYEPYFSRMNINGAYATSHEAFRFDYHSEFLSRSQKLKYLLHVRLSGIEVLRYYGIGNEISLPVSVDNDAYYYVQQSQYIFHSAVQYFLSTQASFTAGMAIKHSDVNLKDSTFIKRILPYGISAMTMASVYGEIEFDSRDHAIFPLQGIYVHSTAQYSPAIMDNKFNFIKTHADMRWYSTIQLLSRTTFAFRAFGEKIFGNYPFYEASYLGGTESVRGFEKQRFSGDASVSLHAESRFYLGKLKLLLPFFVGGTLFGETGRVFVKGERSDLWHSGFGAGLWSYVINNDITVSISIAKSREEIEGHVTTGFTF